MATCGGCCCLAVARRGTRGLRRVAARSRRVAGDLRMLQMLSEVGSTTQRREMGFWVYRANFGGSRLLWLSPACGSLSGNRGDPWEVERSWLGVWKAVVSEICREQ